MRQITRISPCVLTGEYDAQNNPLYGYSEEIIIGADATRFRNGEGEYAVCLGKNTTATEECSFAAGANSSANGYCSFALGYKATTNGPYSFALGHKATANSSCSFALGYNATANEAYSFALGYNVETHNNFSLICGQYNDPLSWALFAVGCGSTPSKKKNAITVYSTCTVNNISYSIGDTVINGVTAYASGKVKMPGITANADGTVDIPKLSQLSNYATKSEINTITEAHKNLSQQLGSNNQAVSKICTTGNRNNGVIKDYAEGMNNADGGIVSMVDIIAELFRAIGDSLQRYPQGVFLRDTLNNGARKLEDKSRGYLNNLDKTIVALKRDLKDF